MRPSMQRPYALALFALLLALAALRLGAAPAHADRPAGPRAAAGPSTIYLPLLARPGGDAVTPTPEPGQRPAVTFTHEAGRAASAAIGPEGGSLSATAADGTRFELSIPPQALEFSETITMTPALAAEGLPLSGGLVGAVAIEPEGLELYSRATLRIFPAAASSAARSIGFAYRGAGEGFHLYPLAPDAISAELQQAPATTIQLELARLRPAGAGRGSQADIDALPITPEDVPMPQDRLEELAARNDERLGDYYVGYLLPELYGAIGDAASLDQALGHFDGWLYIVDSFGLSEEFGEEIATAKSLLGEAVQEHSAASAERCYSEKRPEEGFRLLRWARAAPRLISITELTGLIDKLRGCLRFEVSLRSWITEDEGFWAWRHDLHAEPIRLRWSDGMRATGSGALTYDAVTWTGSPITGCTLSGSGSGSTLDMAGGSYGLSISPVSRTSPAVTVRLSYDPGTPIETKSIVCDSVPGGTHQVQHWRDYYAQMHDYERSGGGFTAQATVVGAGSFEGWVYNHSGTGSQGALQEESAIEIRHTPERP